jgi:hypothetical protein
VIDFNNCRRSHLRKTKPDSLNELFEHAWPESACAIIAATPHLSCSVVSMSSDKANTGDRGDF